MRPNLAGSSSSNPYPDVKSQKAFEKGLIDKTSKQTGDIILYDNRIVLYKLESDVMIYVVGSVDENEILLYNTILALRDSLHLLFKYLSTTPSDMEPSRLTRYLCAGSQWTSGQSLRTTTWYR